jgi:hypothetical protein
MTPSDRPYLAEYCITDAEAAQAGVRGDEAINAWGDLLRPLMLRKGCPEDQVFVGNPRLLMHRREGSRTYFRLYFEPSTAPCNA